MPPTSRVALFGGTFDPPHLGHLAIASAAVEQCQLDCVIFIPCRQSPHKSDAASASADQRCEMLSLCTADLPWAEISRFELERSDPSYSSQTAQEFASRRPDAELFWILGQDQWDVIHTWHRPETLRDLVTFVVFPRGDASLESKPDYRARFLHTTHPASATRIRKAIEEKKDVTSLLHPAVIKYIAAHHLYTGPQTAN